MAAIANKVYCTLCKLSQTARAFYHLTHFLPVPVKQQLEITKFEKFRVELEHREINFLYAKHCVCLNGHIDIDCTQVITNVLNQVLFHIFFYIVKLKQVLFHIFFFISKCVKTDTVQYIFLSS